MVLTIDRDPEFRCIEVTVPVPVRIRIRIQLSPRIRNWIQKGDIAPKSKKKGKKSTVSRAGLFRGLKACHEALKSFIFLIFFLSSLTYFWSKKLNADPNSEKACIRIPSSRRYPTGCFRVNYLRCGCLYEAKSCINFFDLSRKRRGRRSWTCCGSVWGQPGQPLGRRGLESKGIKFRCTDPIWLSIGSGSGSDFPF